MTYVKIYCDRQRERDMGVAWPWKRWEARKTAGSCYAQKLGGAWFCCCCGRPVRVVEP